MQTLVIKAIKHANIVQYPIAFVHLIKLNQFFNIYVVIKCLFTFKKKK